MVSWDDVTTDEPERGGGLPAFELENDRDGGWSFDLDDNVGPREANKRQDVIKVETLLGNNDYLDLSETDGPTGYWGSRVEKAVKDATGLGKTDTWKEGETVKGFDDPPLQPGTALATFNKDGKYEGNSTGNHAVIFQKYGEEDGKPGIVVLEQWGEREAREGKPRRDAQPVREKHIPFESGTGVYQAKLYSVIKPR